ncbi:hypothetical protein D9M68_791660 [compost metagenome]
MSPAGAWHSSTSGILRSAAMASFKWLWSSSALTAAATPRPSAEGSTRLLLGRRAPDAVIRSRRDCTVPRARPSFCASTMMGTRGSSSSAARIRRSVGSSSCNLTTSCLLAP